MMVNQRQNDTFRESRRLPYPPFGKRVAQVLNQPEVLRTYSGSSLSGNRGTVWIANGVSAWQWASGHPRHLVVAVPFESDPSNYRWDFLVGHEPVLLLPPAADLFIAIRQFRDALGLWRVSRLLAIGSRDSRAYRAVA